MILKKQKYNTLDVLRIPFKIAPLLSSLLLLLMVISAIVPTIGSALSTAYFIDTAQKIFGGDFPLEEIYLPLFLLIGVLGVASITGNIMDLILSKINFELELKLAPEILVIQTELEYKHIENKDTWELIDRMSSEMSITFMDGIRAFISLFKCIVSILLISGLILFQVWWATIIIVLCSIPLFIVSLRAGTENYEAKVNTRKFERLYSYYSDEVLTSREATNERVLFGYTEPVSDIYYLNFEKARDIQLKVLLKTQISMKFMNIALLTIISIVSLLFINPFLNGEVSAGMFIGIITSFFALSDGLGWQLQDATKNLTETREYMDDLTYFVSLSRTKFANCLPKSQPFSFESLEFVDVRYKYNNSDYFVLNRLSFKIVSGRHYAFVGANGAGKTTIVKLIMRLYDDYDGKILLNNRNLKDYSLDEIKSAFSIVFQDFSKYEIPLSDNIMIGNISNNMTKKEILSTAEKSGLKRTITELPKGIDTELGRIKKDGLDLSGGQWQKVAFARSIISSAPMQIFDEPTAALDPISESELYLNYKSLMKGKTTIFISHRLGSTKLADEIFVLENGSIIESGSHDYLMETSDLYAKMFHSQRRWYE